MATEEKTVPLQAADKVGQLARLQAAGWRIKVISSSEDYVVVERETPAPDPSGMVRNAKLND